jgi:hypothetical protein
MTVSCLEHPSAEQLDWELGLDSVSEEAHVFSQPVGRIYSQPVGRIYSQPVGRIYSQPVGRIYSQNR